MHRVTFIFLALIVGILLEGAHLARAQSPTGGPTVPTNQPRGPQPWPSNIPTAIRDAPYNGPSPKAPANIRTAQDAQTPAGQAAMQAAAGQSRAAAARGLGQRALSGDRTLPQSGGRSYGLTQRVTPPARPRSGPVERVMSLLGFHDAVATPEDQPDAAPDDEPSLQNAACAVYAFFNEGYDYTEGYPILNSIALNVCGVIPGGEIAHTEIAMFIYRCGAYFPTWDICLGATYYAPLFPYCEAASSSANWLWCGPRSYYPYQSGGYFMRAYANVTLWTGEFGSEYVDSPNVGFQCNPGYGFLC